MTAKQNEFAMVKYFLGKTVHRGAWLEAVYANVVTHRQMRQSFVTCFIGFFGFFILGALINNAPLIPHHKEIGEVCIVLSIATGFIFGARAVMKFWKVQNLCDYFSHGSNTHRRGGIESAIQDFLDTSKTFWKLAGKRPEKLGLQGTAKLLINKATVILNLKVLRRSEREFVLRQQLRDLYDVASKLMLIPSYKEIYSEAEKNQPQSDMIPRTANQAGLSQSSVL